MHIELSKKARLKERSYRITHKEISIEIYEVHYNLKEVFHSLVSLF